jgi:hypothetical protein
MLGEKFMKKLVLTAAFLGGLAHLATGCLITTGDGDPPIDEFGSIAVSWSLVMGDNNVPAVDCDGGTTMAVISVDSLNQEFVDLYDCAPTGDVITADLYPDLYFVYLEVRDDTNTVLYAQSLGQDVDVFAGFTTDAGFEFSIDHGAFDIGWDIYDGATPITCAEAGATEFALDSTYILTSELYTDYFACDLYEGTSAALPIGDWAVSPSIIDDTQLAIAVGDSIDTDIAYGNEYRDLGVAIIDLQAP